MKPRESNAAPPRRGRCSSCSEEATNSCAGCLDAPAYGTGASQPTFYCSAHCQKAHWSTHKAQCKALQTRKAVFRAVTVLEAAKAVIDAKGKQAMARLAVFLTELFSGETLSGGF